MKLHKIFNIYDYNKLMNTIYLLVSDIHEWNILLKTPKGLKSKLFDLNKYAIKAIKRMMNRLLRLFVELFFIIATLLPRCPFSSLIILVCSSPMLSAHSERVELSFLVDNPTSSADDDLMSLKTEGELSDCPY